MKKEEFVETPGRTFLKSTLHVRVLEERGNYLRSVLVGLQFGVIHLPYELMAVVVWPLLNNLIHDLFMAVSGLILVLRGALEAIYAGFLGRLEATDEPNFEEIDDE